MKFSVTKVGKAGRLGLLTGMNQRPGETFETPLLTMHTRGGNVPHITHEVLQMISTENFIMHMPLTSIMAACSSIESQGRGLSEFVGLKEYPSYVTPQDPANESPTGYNVSDRVAIWTRNGKREVDPTKYMTVVEKIKPDMYLALCDGDTNIESSKKRVMKSVSRSLSMFKECYSFHHGSVALKQAALLAPLEGGYDIQARRVFTEELIKYDVNGFVLDGLHINGPEVESINYCDIEAVVTECVERLPNDKLRVAHGAWSPATLLQLVAAGFDMFDSSISYLATERGAALTFPFDTSIIEIQPLPNSASSSGIQIKPHNSSCEISLEDKVFMDDFRPILKNCNCLTCKHHTRAYIHHLLICQELLGRVLLMIHNLHHYLEFFKAIRKAIQSNTLDDLTALVNSKHS